MTEKRHALGDSNEDRDPRVSGTIRVQCGAARHAGKVEVIDQIRVRNGLLSSGVMGSAQLADPSKTTYLIGDRLIDQRDLFGDSRSGPSVPSGAVDFARERRAWECTLCGRRSRVVVVRSTVYWVYRMARLAGLEMVELAEIAARLNSPDQRER